MAQVSDRVRRLRKERGLTQEEVARRAGLTLNSYGDIERGHVRDPHLSSLGAIAQALGVPIEALVSEEMAVPLADAPREPGRLQDERSLELEAPERPPLGPASPSQQPTLNKALEEERRAAWESAVENARGLRESGQARMTELLSLWRASRERQEDADARLEYRTEMEDLLIQARKAESDLFRNITWSSPEARRAKEEAKKAGAREVPYADWEEYREAARFYYRLLGMVEGQQGLFVRQEAADEAAEEAAAEHAQSEPRALRVVEDLIAA